VAVVRVAAIVVDIVAAWRYFGRERDADVIVAHLCGPQLAITD
jgi:Na+/glutamate symporter